MALSGGLDLLDRHGLHGWIQETDDPDTPVSLVVKVDGQVVARTLANLYRNDLEKAGIGSGRHAFALKLEHVSAFEPHVIEVVREHDEAPVPGTPRPIPASPELNDAMQDHLVALLSHADSEDTFKRWATFLAQQADHLLQRRADAASNKPHPTAPREFRVRWSGRGPAPNPDPAPRALIIDETLPVSNRDAGSRAILSHMTSLQRLGFKVVFAPSDMKGGPGAAELESLDITCCCSPWCGSVEEVLRREAAGFALIYIHRGSNTRYLSLVRHYQPRARVVYSVADLHHLRLARQAEVEERPELVEASRRVRAVELAAARFVDGVITHSTFERSVILKDVPAARVHVVPWSIPPRRGRGAVGGACRHRLHRQLRPPPQPGRGVVADPGRHAAGARQEPGHRVHSSPAAGCRMRCWPPWRRGSGPIGFVDDLAALFGQIRLDGRPRSPSVRGSRARCWTASPPELPCAPALPIAAEGMDLPGILQSTIGTGAQGLADVILRLHDDEAFNAECSQAGLDYIAANMSEAASRCRHAGGHGSGCRPREGSRGLGVRARRPKPSMLSTA